MALQVTRVEQAMGNGLRRLYRLPKLTTAPSKASRSADDFSRSIAVAFDCFRHARGRDDDASTTRVTRRRLNGHPERHDGLGTVRRPSIGHL